MGSTLYPPLHHDLIVWTQSGGYIVSIPARFTDNGHRLQRIFGSDAFDAAADFVLEFSHPCLWATLEGRRRNGWKVAPHTVGYSEFTRSAMVGVSRNPKVARLPEHWKATGTDAEGRKRAFRYSVPRYGEQGAIALAVERRLWLRRQWEDHSAISHQEWCALIWQWYLQFGRAPFDPRRLIPMGGYLGELLEDGSVYYRVPGEESVRNVQHIRGELPGETRVRALLRVLGIGTKATSSEHTDRDACGGHDGDERTWRSTHIDAER